MDLIGLGVLLGFGLVTIVLWTRGVFARDLTQALRRVTQQEQVLQEKADILEQRLTQLERDYQAKLKRAEVEGERIVQDAKNQAMNIRAVAIEEAKHRARQLLLEAEHGKVRLKAELAKEVNGNVLQRACESLRTLLPQTEVTTLHRTLVAELLDSLQQMDVGPFRGTVEQLEVTIAQPFGTDEEQRLRQWAVVSLGDQVPLKIHADPTLVAGCVVRMGPTIVDNSLRNRLSQPQAMR